MVKKYFSIGVACVAGLWLAGCSSGAAINEGPTGSATAGQATSSPSELSESPTTATRSASPSEYQGNISASFDLISPKGYKARVDFTSSAPTIELGDPGKIKVVPNKDSRIVITNETEGGRPVVENFMPSIHVVWNSLGQLAQYSPQAKDCTNFDPAQVSFAAITWGGNPPGQSTVKLSGSESQEFNVVTENSRFVFSDCIGESSADENPQFPEAERDQVADLIARRPDLIVFRFDTGGFADGIANNVCTFGKENSPRFVQGVSNGYGVPLSFDQAHQTPGSDCHRADARPEPADSADSTS